MLVNELIREYLRYNGYGHTLSVFNAEANLQKDVPDREYIVDQLALNTKQYPQNIPLLYGLAFRQKTLSELPQKRVLRDLQAVSDLNGNAQKNEPFWHVVEGEDQPSYPQSKNRSPNYDIEFAWNGDEEPVIEFNK